MSDSCELAATPGFGRVYHCGNCDSIHLLVGPVNLALTPPAYVQLVEMVNRSAANFEVLMERTTRKDADHPSPFFPGTVANGD